MEILRPALIHPLALYAFPWLLVALMYAWGWSSLLLYDAIQALVGTLIIVFPLVISWLYWHSYSIATQSRLSGFVLDVSRMEKASRWLIIFWAAFSLFEIWISHGVPIIWYITGDIPDELYFAFGIPSVHGFVNTMLLAAVTMRVALAFITHNPRHLLVLAVGLIWSMAIISRQMTLVLILQASLIGLQYRKISFRKLAMVFTLIFAFAVIVFGLVGDFRSPQFVENLSGMTEAYPKWLPNGVIWAYLYVTTPLGNLLFTIDKLVPNYDWTFAESTALLLPSAIRSLFLSNFNIQESGVLVSSVFNVSTAYIGPYQDFGFIGISLFAWATMGLMVTFWWKRNVFGSLCYATVGQCAFFSIFFNHFFYLPIIFQMFWYKLCVREWREAAYRTEKDSYLSGTNGVAQSGS